MRMPELIVMLTQNDYTIANACEIFEVCKQSDAEFWGMKEKGIDFDQMKQLFNTIKQCGKKGVLEVVAYTEQEGLRGAQIAAECKCDILLGTRFYDSINLFCKENNIKYMPFVGDISGRPSVLTGNVEDMVAQATEYVEKGAYGVDLLSYRYDGDPIYLSEELVNKTNACVCIAGSINDYEKLEQVINIAPAYFTIGGAFYERRFGEDICEQINKVYSFVNNTVKI